MPNTRERDVLRLFAALHAGVGEVVEVKTLWLNWRLPGSALADALESLVGQGMLTGNSQQTSFALTEAGNTEMTASIG